MNGNDHNETPDVDDGQPRRDDRILIEDNVRVRHFDVDQNFDGWRLDNFLQNRIGSISRTFAGKIAKHGDVEVHPPRKIKAGTFLRDGDEVIVREHLDPEWVQDPQVDILFEGEILIAINKPAGMLIHQVGTTHLNTVEKFLERSGRDQARTVHRLDRETSGVVLGVLDPDHEPPLREAFRDRRVEKRYRALVIDEGGRWAPGCEETIDFPLGHDPDSEIDHKMAHRPGEEGKRAVTHVRVRQRLPATESRPALADLEVSIDTGRQHQIRAHLADAGTPIAGDKLYAHDDRFFEAITDYPEHHDLIDRLVFERHALHAWKLEVPHPVDDRRVSFEAPLPAMWRG